jgi:DNA-directed RNA polymerase specialized sigma24 family protein
MTDVQLEATRDFDELRERVWVRVRSRHAALDRDRFEDAYAEWWSREVARALEGRPSSAGAPVAFVSEGVHRVLIDESRSLARGLARGEQKSAHRLVDLDDHQDLPAVETTPAQAAYEALAHRVLLLVRDRLSARELRVFVWTYLYLRSTPETARALGLSEPRVKKDRKAVAGKVGHEVWALIGAELAVCLAYSEQRVTAAFEVFTLHAEDCPECSAAVGDLRDGALAIVGPIELVALGGAGGGGFVQDLLDGLAVRLGLLVHRTAEVATSMPGGARAAAVAAVGAAAIAGSTALPARPHETEAAVPTPTPAVVRHVPAPPPSPVVAAQTATPVPTGRPARHRRPASTPAPPTPPTPAVTATAATFESPAAPAPRTAPSPPADDGEFGFEH